MRGYRNNNNNGLRRRDIVKSDLKQFLKDNNNKIALAFSKKLYRKYGFLPCAIAGLISEIKSEVI